MVDPDMPELVQTLVQAAKGGDVAAIKVILDRLVPPLKPTADSLSMRATGTLEERGQAIINAMTVGRIGPDTAKTAIDVLAAQAKLIEQSDLVSRMDQLEALVCGNTSKP